MKKLFPFNKDLGILSFTLFLLVLELNCKAQNWSYKSIPASYLPTTANLSSYQLKANSAKAGAYDLTQSLPSGYVTDGSVDYTQYLQKGINSNHNVVFPNFPVLINDKGLALTSNSTVIFNAKSKLILLPTAVGNYHILGIYDISNVKVYFPVIQGDRVKHTGTVGEWGMGIAIQGSSDIQIFNPKISNCWGDGIYIGKSKTASKNIYIAYAQCDNNRRNGISIVSVDSLNLIHPLVSNINGTEPMAGIDIEPNGNSDNVDDINIDRPITFNSKRGILLVLLALPGPQAKQVNIKINDHLDDQSITGFHYSGLKKTYNGSVLNGSVKIINPVWKKNVTPFGHPGSYDFGPQITFSNVSIIDKDGKNVAQKGVLDKIKKDLNSESKVSIR